jgi:hypothetical protein
MLGSDKGASSTHNDLCNAEDEPLKASKGTQAIQMLDFSYSSTLTFADASLESSYTAWQAQQRWQVRPDSGLEMLAMEKLLHLLCCKMLELRFNVLSWLCPVFGHLNSVSLSL